MGSAKFDPYHKWLGIAPKDQPPNHYRLLGIDLFESDPAVIANAADQRMVHVKSFATGSYSAVSQHLLNEIAAAKICLLMPAKKKTYDQTLRAKRTPRSHSVAQAIESPPVAQAIESPIADIADLEYTPLRKPVPKKKSAGAWLSWGIAGLLAALAVVALVVIAGNRDSQNPATTTRTQAPKPAMPKPAELAERTEPKPTPQTQVEELRPGAIKVQAKGNTHAQRPSEPIPEVEAKPERKLEPRVSDWAQPGSPSPPTKVVAEGRGDAAAGPDTTVHDVKEALPTIEAKPQPTAENSPLQPEPETKPNGRPVPSDAAQAEAMKLVKEVYGDEYVNAKTPEQKDSLAKKLLDKANATQDDPTSRFVLLKLARDIAVQAVNGELAFGIIDKMAEAFQITPSEMKTAALTGISKKAHTAAEHKFIAEQAIRLMDELTGNDDFDAATQLGELGLREGRSANDPQLLTQVQATVAEIHTLAKAYEEVKGASKVLEGSPADPAANLTVGKYLCFVKGDWHKGLAMLALGGDEGLKALAVKDVQGATSPDQQVKLADAWWEIATSEKGNAKTHLQERARHWYKQALPGLTGLLKDKVEKRMATLEQTGKDTFELSGRQPGITADNTANPAGNTKKRRGQAATIFACCDDHCDIYVNGEKLLHADISPVAMTDCALAKGDIITVKCTNDWGGYGFACAIVIKKRGVITTGAAWKSYTPKSTEAWFDTKGIQEAKPVTKETSNMGGKIEEQFGKVPSYRLQGRHVKAGSAPALKCQGIWAFNDPTHCYLFFVVP